MVILEKIASGIVVVGNVLMAVMMAYYLYLSIFGFRKKGRTYAAQEPETRFLILVPAHNEEDVIADMVRNLDALEYPNELYDFFIIADNCTDNTAGICRDLGAKVIETQKEREDSPTGKPIALQKALQSIPDYEKHYDLLMIFDADNLMDSNMLQEVNSQYISEDKPEIIQCYLGTKNRTGVVPLYDHIAFAISNRFMNLAKYNMGLNAAVGGTGFAIQTSYLHERGGWTTESLTEDFEMQLDVILSGGRVLWNHNVRIYDEKPTNMIASFNQRVRWAQGRWFVSFRNTKRLFSTWIHGGISFAEMLSLFTHMYSMVLPIFAIIMMLCNGIIAIAPWFYGNAISTAISAAQSSIAIGSGRSQLLQSALTMLFSVAMVAYSFFFLFWWAERVDNDRKVRLRDVPKIIVSYLVNIVNVTIAQWVGLFKHRQQSKWVKTTHKISEPQAIGTQSQEVNS